MSTAVQVGIVMGSDSDWPTMEAAAIALTEFGVGHDRGIGVFTAPCDANGGVRADRYRIHAAAVLPSVLADQLAQQREAGGQDQEAASG